MMRNLLATIGLVVLLSRAALAANTIYTWDASGTHSLAPTDGSGTWDTSSAYWTTGGASDVAFGNSTTSQANVGTNNGAAGTISISGTVTLNKIAFSAPGSGSYTLAGSGTLSFGGAASAISIAASQTPTINTVLGDNGSGITFSAASASSGSITLGGANTFSGTPTLSQVAVIFTTLQNGGVASSFGEGVNTVPVVVGNNGSFAQATYTGAGGSTDRPWTVNGTGGGTINNSGSGAISFDNTGPMTGGATGNRSLTLGGSYTTAASTFAELFSDMSSPTYTTSLKVSAGKWLVTGQNTHSGGTTLSGGTLQITNDYALGAAAGPVSFTGSAGLQSASANVTLGASRTVTVSSGYTASFGVSDANDLYVASFITGAGSVSKGTPSSLGLGAASTGGRITLGNSTSAGTFRYVGTGNSATTRPLYWTATTGGLALDNASIGTIAYLSTAQLVNGNGIKTLTLTGSNTGTNTLAQPIGDSTSATSVTKSGAGTWVLAGSNTFLGGVNLNGGDLQVNAAETPGTSGPLGKSGTISFGGGTLQYSSANAYDYSARFSTAASQAYSIDTAGQTVTFASALTSSNGTLTVDSAIAGGKLVLSGADTYTGDTTILGGTLSVNSDGKLGATSGDLYLNGGALSAAASFTLNANRGLFLGPASGTGGGTLDVPAGVTLTYAGAIANNGGGSGSLTKTGSGTLALSTAARSTYTGGTTIGGGTVTLSGYATLGTSSNLTIASGATLDVSSATGGYTLGSHQTLVAGNGTSLVKGKLSLGSAALALFWTNGVPSLTISGNTLVMNNNTATITVAGSTPLAVGVYKIISKGSGGSVSGTVSGSLVNVAGAGAAAGGSLQITSGELYLNIHGSGATTTSLNSSALTQTYGSDVTFTATVSPATATGIVTFSDGTTTYGSATLVSGQAALTVAGGVQNAGVYPMTAGYNGNATYGPSVSGVVTQMINQALLAVAANNVSRWTGNANPPLTASYLGLVAGDTTAVLAGAPNLATTATTASPIGNYAITLTPGTLTNLTGNYALGYSNGTLSVVSRAMPYPQGTAFPLMMYEVGDSLSAANLAAYGWNIIQTYGLATNSDINSYLQLAYPYSLGGDVPIPCGGDVSTNFVEWPQSQVRAWIQGSAANNNIGWWDMPEEMRSWKPTEVQLLKDYRAWVRLYDTNGPRPTYEYTPNDRILSTQLGVVSNVDIVGASCYCEAQGQPHAWVRYKVQETGVHAITAAGATVGSNYLSGQKIAVGVLYLADPGNGSLPSPQQSYHDVWSSIASGAQGIAVWAYWHGINDNPVLTNNLNEFNLAASQISGSEIGQVILFGAPNTNVDFAVLSGPTNTVSFLPGDGTNWQYPSINVLCKSWSNHVYVVAVNSTSNTVVAAVTNLPPTAGSALLPFELRSLPVTNNSLTDAFQPWDAHVYKLAAAAVAPPTISSIVLAGGNVVLSCSGTPGSAYVLTRGGDLTNPGGWGSISTNTAPGSGLFSCTNSASGSAGFYRLRVK